MADRPPPYRIAEFRDHNDVPWFACQCWYPGLTPNGAYRTLHMGAIVSSDDAHNAAAFLTYDAAYEYLQKVIAAKKSKPRPQFIALFDENGDKIDTQWKNS